MNKLVFAGISALAIHSSLMAEENKDTCFECEYDPCIKPCIDCECYTPKYYDLQCDYGIFFTVDFLYWYARETALSYAMKVEGIQTGPRDFNLLANEIKRLDTSWDPGFRVGLGLNFNCDGWDLFAHWTYYRNNEKETTSVPIFETFPKENEFGLRNPWVDDSFEGSFGEVFDSIAAKWTLRLNAIDLELGRKYWLSRCFTLRPYAGLRGVWTRTRFSTKSILGPQDFAVTSVQFGTKFASFNDLFKNRVWGVGLLAGLQPNWHFCRCFILFANLDAALLWGRAEMKKREKVFSSLSTQGQTPDIVEFDNLADDDYYTMQAILDLGIGLRWERNWCCDRYRTALDVGWEHHIWWDHNQRYKVYDNGFSTNSGLQAESFLSFVKYDETIHNLVFGGLVVRARFDF